MSHILVIDDDLENRDILRARLEHEGHKVTEAPNGEDGLRLAEEIKPDLVFLDVMMPKIDGLQVCHDIKNNPKTEKIPIILLTACDQPIDKLRGWESGADEYMVKPWELSRLLELLKKWCPPTPVASEGGHSS